MAENEAEWNEMEYSGHKRNAALALVGLSKRASCERDLTKVIRFILESISGSLMVIPFRLNGLLTKYPRDISVPLSGVNLPSEGAHPVKAHRPTSLPTQPTYNWDPFQLQIDLIDMFYKVNLGLNPRKGIRFIPLFTWLFVPRVPPPHPPPPPQMPKLLLWHVMIRETLSNNNWIGKPLAP